VVERYDSYRGTSAEPKLSPKLGVQGVTFFARRQLAASDLEPPRSPRPRLRGRGAEGSANVSRS
jgi:hypothetical protein